MQDWVKLAVNRARLSNTPAVFWLDEKRAHDAQIIAKVKTYLAAARHHGPRHPHPRRPPPPAQFTLERLKAGQDTISVTGNVLRDYLTDLFPILEVGTSAKMLSIVPLMNGGGLFETGAGGSAPKHVAAVHRGKLPPLGLARRILRPRRVASSTSASRKSTRRPRSSPTPSTPPTASSSRTTNRPRRKVGAGIDNRGSHFYLALYWAQALAAQTNDSQLSATFKPVAAALDANEAKIVSEFIAIQGKPTNIGGYYQPDDKLASAALRPSPTLNAILAQL